MGSPYPGSSSNCRDPINKFSSGFGAGTSSLLQELKKVAEATNKTHNNFLFIKGLINTLLAGWEFYVFLLFEYLKHRFRLYGICFFE